MEGSKKSLIAKTWERCRSMSNSGGSSSSMGSSLSKARSWPRRQMEAPPPAGWFAVYVGQGKERFVVRTTYLNHHIFRTLLEEVEEEFGYATNGPLELPCDADLFRKLLWEVEQDVDDGKPVVAVCPSPLRRVSSYRLLSPHRSSRRLSGRPRRSYSSSLLKL